MNKLNTRNVWLIILALIFTLIIIPHKVEAQTYGPNLVVNPGFEDVTTAPPMTGWTLSSNTAIETNNIISELRSMRFSNVNNNQYGSVYQIITVEEGSTYKFTFSGFALDAYGPAGGTLTSPRKVNGEVKEGNAATGTALISPALSIASSAVTTVSGEFTVPTGVTQVFVRLIKSYGICTVDDITLQLKQWNIAASSANGTIGSVSGGGSAIASGSTVSLTATPETGYHFVNWTENGTEVSTSATYEFTASADRSLVANFEPDVVSISTGTTNVSDIAFTTSDVTIASGAELIINANKTLKSISVAAGGKLTMQSAYTLNATNGITLQNTAGGTASFVDERTADSPTTIAGTVEQVITETNRNWYVAVPVTGQEDTDITLSGAKIVERDEINGEWDDFTGSLLAGKGYIAVASATSGSTTWSLAGNLNSGKVEVGVTRSGTGFNLLGNPYPSYLNWEQVLNLNATNATLLQGSIWYRTATYSEAQSKFIYSFNTYNSASRIATPTSTTGYIPPMQAFWVRANSAGTVTFTNAMRSHGDGASNKLKAPKMNMQKVIRLQLTNSAANSDEAVLYFDANAQNSFDAYDSPKMFNNIASQPEIYSKAGTEKLVINGLTEVSDNLELPIGFTTGTAGNFTFKATELTNFDSNTRIFLRDKSAENTEVELAPATEYTFSSGITSANESRFSLIFRAPGVTTGNTNMANERVSVFVNAQNEIVINANAGSKYAIYNAMGQQIENGTLNLKRETRNSKLETGVYVVRVGNITERIIIK